MGAWSEGSFGNDDAADWVNALEEQDDLSFVEATIARALVPPDEYLESPTACEAIAAAEVVARLLGNWGMRDAETEPVDAWVERVGLRPSSTLVIRTQDALSRILAPNSELLELWEESDDSASWMKAMVELRSRVRAS
jgi:hypothetical protein